MARPFDGSINWWTEELRQIAQITHQGHHTLGAGSWRTCPMASCARIRSVLEEVEVVDATVDGGAQVIANRWVLRRAIDFIRRSHKVSYADECKAVDVLGEVCYEQFRSGEMTGYDCPPFGSDKKTLGRDASTLFGEIER